MCLLFNSPTSQVYVTHIQVLYMCTLCDSTNINTIIQFVSNCSYHVTGFAFYGDSDSNRSVPEYTRTLSLEIVHTAFEWNCQRVVVSWIWCGITAG